MKNDHYAVNHSTARNMNTKSLLLAPHNDDEALFASYIILKHKPLVCVVTDSYRQELRGDAITKEQRISETEMAMDILDADVKFLHIPDNAIGDDALDALDDFEVVYAPQPEFGGNPDHNKIGELAKNKWKNVIFYSTYTAQRPYPHGEPIPYTDEMYKLKMMALDSYQSQLNMSNKYYFDMMRKMPECLIPTRL